ncbi:MAG: hypothetical protein AB7V18_15245 [Pyrinomonadaceae bacterium]
MEILNSGSFITLDDRNKIEQLIHTSKELANATSQASGFESDGGSKQKLALEMWQGAEYVTRAHEEATIKNIFLSNFLKQLAELDREKNVPVETVSVSPIVRPTHFHSDAAPSPPDLPSESTVTADEYLGVISAEEAVESLPEKSSYAYECIPEGERETDECFAEDEKVGTVSVVETESVQPDAPTTQVSEAQSTVVATEPIQDTVADETQAENNPAVTPAESVSSIQSIVLPEKEPYNFDSSTITAAIQLLPTADGVRKCVISVRSHDFTPLVTISELSHPLVIGELTSELHSAFGQYQADLPARSAEKLKKEKSSTKKRTAKPADKANASPQPTLSSSAMPAPTVAAPSADQANLFAS